MRAGDVIPQVVSPVTQRRTGKEKPLQAARRSARRAARRPSSPRARSGPAARTARTAPARSCRRSSTSSRSGAMDIEGFGEKLVYRFYDEGLVRSLPDIYGLTVERLEPLEGFQRRSAENLVSVDRELQAPAVPPRAVRARHPGHRRRERARARLPLRLDRPADGRLAGGDRGGRGHRARCWPASITETLAEPRNRKLIEELREAGLQYGAGARGRGPATATPLDGQDLRAHRHARGHDAARRRPSASRSWAAR